MNLAVDVTLDTIASVLSIVGVVLGASWVIIRKLNQIDNASTDSQVATDVAAAAAQSVALLDRSVKDIPEQIAETFEQRDQSFARLMAPYLADFRVHERKIDQNEVRIRILESGQNKIFERLDDLSRQSASDTAKVLGKIDTVTPTEGSHG